MQALYTWVELIQYYLDREYPNHSVETLEKNVNIDLYISFSYLGISWLVFVSDRSVYNVIL